MQSTTRRMLHLRQRYGWRVNVGRIAYAERYEVTARHAIATGGAATMDADRYEWLQGHYRDLRRVALMVAQIAERVLAAVGPDTPACRLATAERVRAEVESHATYAPADQPISDPDLSGITTAPRPGPVAGATLAA